MRSSGNLHLGETFEPDWKHVHLRTSVCLSSAKERRAARREEMFCAVDRPTHGRDRERRAIHIGRDPAFSVGRMVFGGVSSVGSCLVNSVGTDLSDTYSVQFGDRWTKKEPSIPCLDTLPFS